MIGSQHIPYLKEIFALPDLLSEPAAVFGFHDVGILPGYFEPWSALPKRAKLELLRDALRRHWRAARGPRQGVPRPRSSPPSWKGAA
jgi:hypothetical protein